MTNKTNFSQPSRQLIDNFHIHLWLSALLAVGFGGAVFAHFGIGLALLLIIVGFFASVYTLNLAYQHRHSDKNLESTANGLVMAGLMFSAIALFDKGIVLALLCLLFFLHLALNVHFTEHRQVYFGLIISFLGLMVGASQTFSTGYLLFVLIFCLCACFYLSLVFIDKQKYQYHQENLHYIGKARNQDKFLLAVWLVMIAGILYLITPHFSAGNLGKSVLDGFGKYDNPNLEQQILPENTDLSQQFNEPKPQENQQNSNKDTVHLPSPEQQLDNSIYYYVKSKQPRYLQHDVLSYFDGQSWQKLHHGWRHVGHDNRQFLLYRKPANASVSITVAKVPDNIKLNILSTDNTVAVRFPSLWLARDYYDMLKTGNSLTKNTRYELLVRDDYQNQRLADKFQAKPDNKDLQLPNNLDPRIWQLNQKIVENQSNNYQKAVALEQYLRTSYQYTLDTVHNQNNIPLSDFLFGSRRGHCEYYATAMTVMLRQQGIPARYVVGFVARDYNPVTGFYEVKGTNAHAWVEAYIDNSWQIFEATGAYQQPNENPQNSQTMQQDLQDYLNNLQQQDERLAQTQALTWQQKIQLAWYQFWSMLLSAFQLLITLLKWVLPLVLGVLAMMGLMYWVYQKKRISIQDWWDYRQLQQGVESLNDKQILSKYIVIYQQLLARHGIVRQQGQTIEQFAKILMNKQLMSDEQAKIWINLANHYFYQQDLDNTVDIRSFFLALYRQTQQYFSQT